MSFPFSVFGSTPPRPRIQLTQVPTPPRPLDEYDENASDCDQEEQPVHSGTHLDHPHLRTPFISSAPSSPDLSAQAAERLSDRTLLYPHSGGFAGYVHTPYSTASNTPLPSRTPSPSPFFYSSGVSSCSSDSDSEHEDVPFTARNAHLRSSQWREERRRWWIMGAVRRRRRRERMGGWRTVKRAIRLLIRHPFFPKTPITILLTLLLLTILGVSITFLMIYILNPDKEPLPWRGYCTIPQFSTAPPSYDLPTTASFPHSLPENFTPPTFPSVDLDTLSPAGVFVGVFSMDNAVERRMLIRSSWASHQRSRDGAGEGDGGVGTSRTIVRFILGQPRKEWQRRIMLENEVYKDMIILPVAENMNNGKTYAYFSWAAQHAWVPPLYFDTFERVPQGLSYANKAHYVGAPAAHDPIQARQDFATGHPQLWVRPDYVVKTDDDSFVILAELEARLRVELHAKPQKHPRADNGTEFSTSASASDSQGSFDSTILAQSASILDSATTPDLTFSAASTAARVDAFVAPTTTQTERAPSSPVNEALSSTDPLIFWGYLVKNRFMAGELYALSWSLVDWIAHDPQVAELKKGAEDKQTSKWMRLHPRADEVRWTSERCWIYDHPRASTVYSHGFLFPSEARRVQEGVMDDISRSVPLELAAQTTGAIPSPFGLNAPIPSTWSRSTVSKFGTRYSPPLPYLDQDTSIEALVEGSEMSRLTESSGVNPWTVWQRREGRLAKYENKRVGGTIVVHFIKKNMWFLETAAAFLLGEDRTEAERARHWAHNHRVRPSSGRPADVTSPLDEETLVDDASAASDQHQGQNAIMKRHRHR
ncbi:glycosyltransferase family 31 protein [Laetiporus sulphureus 93-53]|uniref:Glycosyltransferase family 31 protein n=1 Tax=Laetiporus sulphureus 93-53 TaxID=1314785 RepID=A0A165CEJ7_9APHY|nr:glycosyltransferase family 31 protein [Laetiporus sulphureus 93-53]KZT02672.1 glycosyltransferase family 31 protein [Laetiporus sulphureus 93-53]